MKTFTPTQTLARQMLEGLFGDDNVKMLKHWKFAIRHYYFYRHGATTENFSLKVQRELADVKGWTLTNCTDNFQAWPELSYFEATILVFDTEAFFQGPAPKAVEEVVEEEPAPAPEPEALPEPAAEVVEESPEAASNLFNLGNKFADRKAWRRAIRNLAADLNAEYTKSDGCYYLVLEDGTYKFSLTDDGRALVILLPE